MKTALLVLDAQKIYTDDASELYCPDSAATIDRINALIKAFETTGGLVVPVRHIHKADGSDTGRLFDYTGEAEDDFNFKEGTAEVQYADSLKLNHSRQEFIKTRYSAFQRTDLERFLKDKGIGRVVICGFMTNFCCESTAREALDRDFYVDFIVDATGTPGTEDHDEDETRSIVADMLSGGFARVFTSDDYVAAHAH